MNEITNREEWLNEAARRIHERYRKAFDDHFAQLGHSRLERLLVSTGFPSSGGLTKVIGQCWKAVTSESGEHHQIFINPRLGDVVEVVATLAHEMVHAADDCESKHRGPFARCVRDLGLEGKATATVAGDEFAEFARGLEKEIGPYPHQRLRPLPTEKKQTTRMLKLEADCCGYVVRTTKKWLEVGTPSCPCGNEFVLEDKEEV